MKKLIASAVLLLAIVLLAPTSGMSFPIGRAFIRPLAPAYMAGYAGYWRWNHRIHQWVWVSTVRVRPIPRRVVIRTF